MIYLANRFFCKIFSICKFFMNNHFNYINAVKEDPSIVTRGISGKDADDFKIWLLEKGHRILSGTSAHRPLWEIE